LSSLCATLRTACALLRITPDEGFPAREPNEAELTMNSEIERNLGEQPVTRIMQEHNLKAHDLVSASPVEMTHKMVARACKGRRLTLNTQSKVLAALNRATGKNYSLRDLFNY
jgi:hypothetical protein